MDNLDDPAEIGRTIAKADGDDTDYSIGYGKPPKQYRFKKGKSGNLKGRPKAKEELLSAPDSFVKVFNTPVRVTINGRPRLVNGIEAALWQLRSQMIGGDIKAMRLVLEFIRQLKIADNSNESNAGLNRAMEVLKEGYAMPGEVNEGVDDD